MLNILVLIIGLVFCSHNTYAVDTTFSITGTSGVLNNLLGVNAGPTPIGDTTVNPDVTTAYQTAGVRLVRTHDFYGPLDLALMYANRTVSPELQSSYNFSTGTSSVPFGSDYIFNAIISGGFEPYFRLGDSYYNATPPTNETERNNLAQASVNILRHYRQGLWNGFNSNFRYVEIWNEPDNRKFWPQPYTSNDFYLLYEKLSTALRSAFPELKIGGPGFAPSGYATTGGQQMVRGFLDYVKSKNLPMDFFSFHFYTDKVEDVSTAIDFYRQELTSRGFNNVELHVTEYNTETMDVSHRAGALGAALNTAFWITMQEKGISIATFYRGNEPDITVPSYYGMLFADGRPKKVGLAFRLWSELYGLSNRLIHTVSGNSTGLYFLAAQDANGNIGALITNLSESSKTWTIIHPTINLNSLKKTLKTVSNSSDEIVTTTPSSLEITISPNTVQLLLLQPITLSVSKTGTGIGTITSSPTGIDCGSTCSASFSSGTTVTLTATAASGSTFAGWSGACSGSSGTCTVTMDASKNVTATFNISSTIPTEYLQTIQRVYVAYYGRPADPGGQDYWASRLQSEGGDLSAIIQAFGTSDEFTRRYGNLSNSDLIDTIYLQMFSRTPDSGGKAFYLDKLNTGQMTLQSITLDVLNGAQNEDLTVINNKLEVANYFTGKVRQGCSYDSEQRGINFLSGITAASSTVTTAKAAIDSYCGF